MNIKWIIPACLLFFHTACTATKKLPPEAKTYSKKEILHALTQHNKDFTWFHGKTSAAIKTAGESQTAQMVIRMKRDSAVWVQIKKFEIEAFRVFVTPQEYTLLHRLESAYEKGSLQKLSEMAGVPLSFEDFQQLIFGNVVLPENENFEMSFMDHEYKIEFTAGGWHFTYYLDELMLQLQKAIIKDANGKTMRVLFSDYKNAVDGTVLPHIREIFFPEKPGTEGIIRLNFSELEINVPKELKFVVPSHYNEYK